MGGLLEATHDIYSVFARRLALRGFARHFWLCELVSLELLQIYSLLYICFHEMPSHVSNLEAYVLQEASQAFADWRVSNIRIFFHPTHSTRCIKSANLRHDDGKCTIQLPGLVAKVVIWKWRSGVLTKCFNSHACQKSRWFDHGTKHCQIRFKNLGKRRACRAQCNSVCQMPLFNWTFQDILQNVSQYFSETIRFLESFSGWKYSPWARNISTFLS